MKFTIKRLLAAFTKIEKTDNYELWSNGEKNIYILRKKASKHTIIHLQNSGDIIWEQIYMFGGNSRPSSVKSFFLKPIPEKAVSTIVVLNGTPLLVKGLDDNIFVSVENDNKTEKILFLTANEFIKYMNSGKK